MKRILSFVLCAVMLMSCFVSAVGADAAQAQAVMDQIAALTKESSDEEIDAAEDAYFELSDEDRALVTNFDRIDEIRNQKKDPAVQAVIQMIAKLDVNSTNDELLAAVSAYEALTEEQKAKVLNYDMIADICDQKAESLVSQINALPEVYFADVFHHESAVKAAMSTYEILLDSSKEKVTNYSKLEAIAEKLEALHAWDADKQVNILNSTLAALGEYTQETIDNFAAQPAIGMYYLFEEVGYVERGDPTTGYFGFEENESNNVKNQKYVKLDFDMKVTNVDVINGWPMLFKMTTNDSLNGYGGYDFINGAYWHGVQTNISHGALQTATATKEADLAFGVWHHFTYTYDNEKFTIVCDGETMLDTTTNGIIDYVIIYPWLCDLEMTNVVYTDRFGKETLSPFRNALNNPTGWSKRSNAKDAVMLDHVKKSVEDARDAYEKLTDEQKAKVVGIEALDKVEAMIERSGKNEIVITDGTADVQLAAEGDTVTVTANEAPAGKVFDKWEVVSGGVTLADANAASTTFVMGAEKVELKAVYKDAGHAVKVTDGTADAASAVAGATVTITAGEAPEGKVFDKWEVVSGGVTLADANAASTTFVMGDADVEIKAVYKNAVMMGDADGNGKVNAKDIIAVMRHMLGNTPDGFIEEAADMDANGKVNAKDIIAIMRAMLGN